jgi:hypothetical protein
VNRWVAVEVVYCLQYCPVLIEMLRAHVINTDEKMQDF